MGDQGVVDSQGRFLASLDPRDPSWLAKGVFTREVLNHGESDWIPGTHPRTGDFCYVNRLGTKCWNQRTGEMETSQPATSYRGIALASAFQLGLGRGIGTAALDMGSGMRRVTPVDPCNRISDVPGYPLGNPIVHAGANDNFHRDLGRKDPWEPGRYEGEQ